MFAIHMQWQLLQRTGHLYMDMHAQHISNRINFCL